MHQYGYIGRKLKQPALKDKPAIVIAAFGTTRRTRYVLDIFEQEAVKKYPDYRIYWAYTSEIIRKRLGLPGLQETLARVESDGYRKVVVQPLHIFPGTEYQQVAETCEYFPGLRVFLGESLLHRWDFIKEVVKVVEPEFVSPQEGCNLLAIHGTPIAADPANIIYLGFEKLLSDMYPHVKVAAVEGIPDYEALFARMKRENLAGRYGRVKIIPMMYFAGMHAEDDLMGQEGSWKSMLEAQGFSVDCPMVSNEEGEFYKGLAYYPQVNEGFLHRIQRALDLSLLY